MGFTLNKKVYNVKLEYQLEEQQRKRITDFSNRLINSIEKLMQYTQNRNARSYTGKLGHCFGVKEIYNILNDNDVAVFLYNNHFFKKMKNGRWFISWSYNEDGSDRNVLGLLMSLKNRNGHYSNLIKEFVK